MKPGKKRQKKLDRRLSDFFKGSQSKEAQVQNRWENRGFHIPGSFNK